MSTEALLGVAEVAERLSIKPATVHDYHKKGFMPRADQYFGRSPAWKATTIETWDAGRPRKKIHDPTASNACS